ncbi:class I SAM-dependent methyltransferase [Halomarina ordinaria]|uniref:Class I SAM-dependent methyltransferase n=1 Tax=Halomarina ordinaria TaxID=3033939 RepID=A0ABD5U502_9EURY|nr:class I SAM-dependent methyltransferase [Halomarina sp. PSRA2]
MTDRRAVRETYDRIAEHFARTRAYAWPEVEAFVEASPEAGTALDLACGNGRHAGLLARRADRVVGLDASRAILGTARERAANEGFSLDLLQGDAAALPLREDSVDLAVYVAALHHLPTPTLRRASLDDLARVLAPAGRALVSVWSVTHSAFDEREGFDTTVDWTLPDGTTVGRYYHVYDPEEFEAAVEASALDVERVYESEGNCYAVGTGTE